VLWRPRLAHRAREFSEAASVSGHADAKGSARVENVRMTATAKKQRYECTYCAPEKMRR